MQWYPFATGLRNRNKFIRTDAQACVLLCIERIRSFRVRMTQHKVNSSKPPGCEWNGPKVRKSVPTALTHALGTPGVARLCAGDYRRDPEINPLPYAVGSAFFGR